MYEVFDHLYAYVKLVYCVTIECLQSDLFLYMLYILCLCALRVDESEISYVCVYVCMCVCVGACVFMHTCMCTHVYV